MVNISLSTALLVFYVHSAEQHCLLLAAGGRVFSGRFSSRDSLAQLSRLVNVCFYARAHASLQQKVVVTWRGVRWPN